MINQSSMKPNSQWVERAKIERVLRKYFPKEVDREGTFSLILGLEELMEAHAKEQLKGFAEEIKEEIGKHFNGYTDIQTVEDMERTMACSQIISETLAKYTGEEK